MHVRRMMSGIRRAAWGLQGGSMGAAQSIRTMMSHRDHQADSGGRIVHISINNVSELGLALA